MEKEKFLNTMKTRVAYNAITPENLDYQQEVNDLPDARSAASNIDLSELSTEDPEVFAGALDNATEQVQEQLSGENRNWGTARTAVNLYLKKAQYNRYLSQSYNLYLAEHMFELPINGISATYLHRHAGEANLPEWSGLHLLEPDVNKRYQQAASTIAGDMRISRIHLDMFLWPGW